MIFQTNLIHKPSNLTMDQCIADLCIALPEDQFCALWLQPLADHQIIKDNLHFFQADNSQGFHHCMLFLCTENDDGILVDPQGYSYVRYGSYLPGAKLIVDAELNRVADYMVRESTGDSLSKNWCFHFDELEDKFGIVISPKNGFGGILRNILEDRKEISNISMEDDCFALHLNPNFCGHFSKWDVSGVLDDRKQRLLNDLIGYLGEHCDSTELSSILYEQLDMSEQDAQLLGFNIPDESGGSRMPRI